MELLKKTAAELQAALIGNYTIDPDNKDVEMLKALEKNVFVFSGFKTYQQLKEISGKLRDENGDLRSFEDFKKEVLKVNQAYNVRYLSSEYDHAVVSSQMASQWVDIQANKEALPYLEFDATLDDRTTSTCRSLDGTRLPVDDPFWDNYYLPLHWHERSVIRQVAGGKLTDKSKLVFPELQPMFKGNVAKDGVIFPQSHPYFDVKAGKDKKRIEDAAKQVEVLSKPRKDQFETSFTNKKTSATVTTHSLADKKKDDYKNNLAIAKAFTKNGTSCELLPEINFNEKAARKSIFPKLKAYSNPDMLTSEGEYIDVKRFENIKNIVKQANRADKQGAIACISDEWHKLTDELIDDKAKQIFKSGYKGDKIYWYKDGKLIVKNRKGG